VLNVYEAELFISNYIYEMQMKTCIARIKPSQLSHYITISQADHLTIIQFGSWFARESSLGFLFRKVGAQFQSKVSGVHRRDAVGATSTDIQPGHPILSNCVNIKNVGVND